MLLFIDNIFRFTQAGSEVSALLGRMPSAVGYQPTLGTDLGELQERITSTNKGSITSVQAVYVPADDLTDPAPATTFSHLDGTLVLSRQIAELGIYPAVDPLDSTSRILDPNVVGEEHYDRPRGADGPAEVQGPPGHHRHSGHGRALGRGQADRCPRPQDPALPLPALPRGRGQFTGARACTSRSRTPSGASRRSWTASTTTSPNPPSTWCGGIDRCWKRKRTIRTKHMASSKILNRGCHPGSKVMSEEVEYVGAPGIKVNSAFFRATFPCFRPGRRPSTTRRRQTYHYVFVAGGFAEVLPNKMSSSWPRSRKRPRRLTWIAPARPGTALKSASRRLKAMDYARARAAMQRALSRASTVGHPGVIAPPGPLASFNMPQLDSWRGRPPRPALFFSEGLGILHGNSCGPGIDRCRSTGS